MDRTQILSFLTPGPRQKLSYSLINTSLPRPTSQSLARTTRKPIFNDSKYNHLSNTTIFNRKHGTLQEQKINFIQIVFSNFCGCQYQNLPCSIINKNFLQNISLNQMKNQYQKIQQPLCKLSYKQIKNCKKLIQQLPKWYPQLYLSHLNNLLKNIYYQQKQQFLYSQFQCLSWIQYHCKIQYLTYYLYMDLKSKFINLSKFQDILDLTLIKFNTSYIKTKNQYLKIIQLETWENIINNYFQSIAAIIIPIAKYAKFISLIKLKGYKVLTSLLSLLLTKHKQNFIHILKLFELNKKQQSTTQINSLNWQQILQSINTIL